MLGGHTPPEHATGWMWDLTIRGDRSFYIKTAATAVLVHNCSKPAGCVYSFPDQSESRGITFVGRALNFQSVADGRW